MNASHAETSTFEEEATMSTSSPAPTSDPHTPRRRATGALRTAAAVLVLLLAAVPARGQEAPEPDTRAPAAQEATLYERLGGVYPIASVVDVFIDLLLHNDVLNENPAIREARDRVPAPGLKYHVTAMVCQATGGPCQYTGRSMEEAHAHLNIGEREWEAMLSDLRRTLNDFQVPDREQEELIAIVQSTKDDIVVTDD
jgi:hemoglobin